MECLFCSIVAGDIPARKVYEDAAALAFLDISPWHKGHTLVITKRHVTDLLDDASGLAEIAPAVHATASLLKEKLGADGLNMLSNVGAVAGQEVFHLHLHLIPRFASAPGIAALRQRELDIDIDEVWAVLRA